MILAAAITSDDTTIAFAEWREGYTEREGYTDFRHLTLSPGTPYEEPMLVDEWIWPYTAGGAICRVIRGGEITSWPHPCGAAVVAS